MGGCLLYLVEGHIRLVHQANVELVDKIAQLLLVSEWFSALHHVTDDPHNCRLSEQKVFTRLTLENGYKRVSRSW